VPTSSPYSFLTVASLPFPLLPRMPLAEQQGPKGQLAVMSFPECLTLHGTVQVVLIRVTEHEIGSSGNPSDVCCRSVLFGH